MTVTYVSVEAHDVQHGDRLAGVSNARRHPIESILWSASEQPDGARGVWIFADARGREMGRCMLGGRVQVLRHEVAVGEPAEPAANSPTADDAPARGITRPFYLVQP